MNNSDFLDTIKVSFKKYLETGSRSNKKLGILHGAIAKDFAEILGEEYKIHSLGYGEGKEKCVTGRYMDKKVDIAIEKDGKIIAAIALKFIMSNYSQNSINYFENMIGETVNIRAMGIPYFQIFIVPTQIPYFKGKKRKITKYETVTNHNLEKYIKISYENPSNSIGTPNEMLMYLVDFPKLSLNEINTEEKYIQYFSKNENFKIVPSKENHNFGPVIIYNNYEEFKNKVCTYVESI